MLYMFLAVIIILLAAILGEGAYIAITISRLYGKGTALTGNSPVRKSGDSKENKKSKEKEQIERFLKYSG